MGCWEFKLLFLFELVLVLYVSSVCCVFDCTLLLLVFNVIELEEDGCAVFV